MPRYTPSNQKKDLNDALAGALPAHDGKARSREYEVRDTRTTGRMVTVAKTGKKAWDSVSRWTVARGARRSERSRPWA